MRRELLLAILLLPLLGAASSEQAVMAETTVAQGSDVSVTIATPGNTTGYLLVVSTNEVGTSLSTVTVYNVTTLGEYVACSRAGIATETTTVILLGSGFAPGGGIDTACDVAMGSTLRVLFSDAIPATSMDFTAVIAWVAD